MAKADDICSAMRRAGIHDANSQMGKDFCTGKCPHSFCVLFDVGSTNTARSSRVLQAKRMYSDGYSIEWIAKALGRSVKTVKRYLE